MTSPGTDDEDRQVSEDRHVSQSLFFISLVAGALGLFAGLIFLLGPRGVVLSLGIVSVVLSLISRQRAVADSERGTALGALVLGLVTIVLGVLVAQR